MEIVHVQRPGKMGRVRQNTVSEAKRDGANKKNPRVGPGKKSRGTKRSRSRIGGFYSGGAEEIGQRCDGQHVVENKLNFNVREKN